jgi:sugar phosphate permease
MEIDATKRYRWLIFAILGAIYFMTCLHRAAPTVIARDLAQAFNANALVLGLIASSYFYLYSAVQPPVGILADTIGPRMVVTILTLIAAAGGLIFGTASNAAMSTLGRALVGAGVGGVFVPSLKIFSKWFRASEFASLTGILLAISGLGGLSAALPLTYMVLFLGWRLSFVLLGAFSLFLALICWAVVRDRPEDKGWPPVEIEVAQPQSVASELPEHMRTIKRLALIFKSFNFWMITLALFFSGGVSLTFQGLWAVPYLIDAYGLSRAKAGALLMLMPFGFGVGAPVFGLLIDRLALNRKGVVMCSLSLSISCWIILLLFGGRASCLLVIPVFFVVGLLGGGYLTVLLTITKELFPPWLTGTAVGLINPAAFLSTALYQPLTGFLLDRVGRLDSGAYPLEAYQLVFIFFIISIIIGLIATIMLSLPKTHTS